MNLHFLKFNNNLFQSSVMLALGFLSPESLGESIRLAQEIRCLPNNHDAKLKMLEVSKYQNFTDYFPSSVSFS